MRKNGVNVLSLFDGMSCGQIALTRANVDCRNYYASEIDKYAVKVTQANFPNTVQLGDITGWREWDIDWSSIDLILAGSPCQGFSFAGSQLAFEDPRSKLFFVFLEILNHIRKVNPDVKFLLENVRMKQEYLGVISAHTGVEPVCINSALVSAQNRVRYYWTNWDFDQPEDTGIQLKDIIEGESEVPDNMYYKEGSIEYMRRGNEKWKQAGRCRMDGYLQGLDKDKSFALTSNMHKGVPYNFCDFSTGESKSYRKLTPLECERLQTVPDNYTNHVSNTQRYKMLGNGWTVDVIAHILRSMTCGRT